MTFDHGLTPRQLDFLRGVLAPFVSSIERVVVFGSRATGKYRPNSDIDLVLYGPVEEITIARLHTLFMDSLLPLKVDIQAYAQIAYPPLRQHIDAVGKTLFVHEDLLERPRGKEETNENNCEPAAIPPAMDNNQDAPQQAEPFMYVPASSVKPKGNDKNHDQ